MATKGWPGVAILRRCRRCFLWRSIEHFSPLGKLCNACMDTTGRRTYRAAGGFAVTRGITITDKGRELLRELERPAA